MNFFISIIFILQYQSPRVKLCDKYVSNVYAGEHSDFFNLNIIIDINTYFNSFDVEDTKLNSVDFFEKKKKFKKT